MNQSKLFNEFIHNLLNLFEYEKGDKSLIVYAHNLSSFDGVFLMKHLFSFGKVIPLLHNGKIISIKLRVGIKGHKNKRIIFKDSLLMLPLSLRDLGDSFKVGALKSYFPFLLKDLTYKSEFPKFEFFTSISHTEYLNLKNQYMLRTNKIWSFKNEAIKYCELDCVSLHQIISKFSILIFNMFKIDPIKRALTLPALALKIWKSLMPTNSVYQLHGQPQELIRKSYTGGAVDVYIPHNKVANTSSGLETLYSYDVNSLYPSVMLNNPMPVGEPIAFLGDIRKVDPEAFGFFYCNITSPQYLEHPILQRRVKVSGGQRTIAGLGSWTGWIFSAEMDNAMRYGYQFEIIKGYEFKKGYVFSDYINKMYNLRLQYSKGEAMNLTAKLLMNSLYGKFGMNSETTKVTILDNKENINKYLDKFNTSIVDIIYSSENHIILKIKTNNFIPDSKNDLFDYTNISSQLDINVAVASAITAYARVHMSSFKNNPNFKLYYSDTDNIVTNKQLPDHMVGSGLGQMKLEHVITKAVFLAPKVYGFIDINGNEIIKAKGLIKDNIKDLKVSDLELLLNKDSSKLFSQSKVHKQLFNSNISVLDTVYTLKVTSNKRQLIYNNGIFDSTKPFNYEDIKS